ncbi:hypothetical protein BDY19DRAFT_898485 [Irpex rosettiformis]|uniref:Uncharacterized protein n=1 Tax=Irpex rosettiformis TaxID=378272 RepID=A0ACB8TRK3_9APHY|nr:hypothetical protein BDY19DRAFT_898485 [Irpex rosettiformis]
MEHGCLAVAMVQRQVMIVQASRSHSSRETWLDVHTFMPFGSNVFLPSPVPEARIPSSDVLTIFTMNDKLTTESIFGNDMLEVSPRAYKEFLELSSRTQKKYERLFAVWSKKSRR